MALSVEAAEVANACNLQAFFEPSTLSGHL